MKKFIFALVPLLLMAAGCTQEKFGSESGIVLDTDKVEISGLGGTAEIGYRITDPVDGQEVMALSGEPWINDIEVSDGKISFSAAVNLTEKAREATVEVTYGNYRSYFTVVQGDEYPVEGEFSIGLTSVNDYEIKCSITPEQEDMPYLYGIIDRATYDRFSSDEYFWDYVIENTPDFASRTATGSIEELSYDHLNPDTRYIIYCAGIDESGENLTDLSILRFSTKDPVSFELTQEVDGPMVTLNVKPSYDDRLFFFDAFTAEECGSIESAPDYVLSLIKDESAQLAWWMGLTQEQYMKDIMTCGEASKKIECIPSTEYYAVAISLDLECNATSEMAIMKFETGEVLQRDLQITIDITDITASSAKWKATASTDDQYLFFVESTDVIKEQWSDVDEELMLLIASIFPTDVYGRFGSQEGDITYLEPDTEYLAFAFGCESSTPTTPLFKKYFTTEKAYVGEVGFELQFDEYYDGTELEKLYPSDFAGASGYAVLPVTPYSEKGLGYYYNIYNGDYTDSEEYPDDMVIGSLETNGISDSHALFLIPYNTARTALGVAYDGEHTYGKVFRELIYCTEDEALPGSEYGKSSIMPASATLEAKKTFRTDGKL